MPRYIALDPMSRGDVFSVESTSQGNRLVKKSTPAVLASTGAPFGMVDDAAGVLEGGEILVPITRPGTQVSPTTSGLAAASGYARVSATARAELVGALALGEYSLGAVDASGVLTWAPSAIISGGDAQGTDPSNLTDASVTVQIGDGAWRVLPLGALTTDRTLTLGTTGAASRRVWRLKRHDRSSHIYRVVNGGAGGGILHESAGPDDFSAQYDGTNWIAREARRPSGVREIHAADFGISPLNSPTDNNTGLAALMAAVQGKSALVRFPRGNIRHSAPIYHRGDVSTAQVFQGEVGNSGGPAGTVFLWEGSKDGVQFVSYGANRSRYRNLGFSAFRGVGVQGCVANAWVTTGQNPLLFLRGPASSGGTLRVALGAVPTNVDVTVSNGQTAKTIATNIAAAITAAAIANVTAYAVETMVQINLAPVYWIETEVSWFGAAADGVSVDLLNGDAATGPSNGNAFEWCVFTGATDEAANGTGNACVMIGDGQGAQAGSDTAFEHCLIVGDGVNPPTAGIRMRGDGNVKNFSTKACGITNVKTALYAGSNEHWHVDDCEFGNLYVALVQPGGSNMTFYHCRCENGNAGIPVVLNGGGGACLQFIQCTMAMICDTDDKIVKNFGGSIYFHGGLWANDRQPNTSPPIVELAGPNWSEPSGSTGVERASFESHGVKWANLPGDYVAVVDTSGVNLTPWKEPSGGANGDSARNSRRFVRSFGDSRVFYSGGGYRMLKNWSGIPDEIGPGTLFTSSFGDLSVGRGHAGVNQSDMPYIVDFSHPLLDAGGTTVDIHLSNPPTARVIIDHVTCEVTAAFAGATNPRVQVGFQSDPDAFLLATLIDATKHIGSAAGDLGVKLQAANLVQGKCWVNFPTATESFMVRFTADTNLSALTAGRLVIRVGVRRHYT